MAAKLGTSGTGGVAAELAEGAMETEAEAEGETVMATEEGGEEVAMEEDGEGKVTVLCDIGYGSCFCGCRRDIGYGSWM